MKPETIKRVNEKFDELFEAAEADEQGLTATNALLVCPKCGAKTWTDTQTPCGDHPELMVSWEECSACDWVGDERPAN